MRKALACFALLFLIAGCDESSKTIITDGADTAIKMFKSEMNEVITLRLFIRILLSNRTTKTQAKC